MKQESESELPVRAYIGLGGNLGDVLGNFRAALAEMPNREIQVLRVSNAFRTIPMVSNGQSKDDIPDYWNAAAEVETSLKPHALLDVLMALEKAAGRERHGVNESRPLDLDLLLYGDLAVNESDLVVPHPKMSERAFVLYPLCELAAYVEVPTLNTTVGFLLSKLDDRDTGVLYRLIGWT